MALPVIDFILTSGLQTKQRQEEARGFLTATNVDTFDKLGAIGKVPGSSRKSNTGVGAFNSLHFFEGFDLTNAQQRQVIGYSSTTLYEINSDQSLTSLSTLNAAEPLFGVTSSNRLHLCSAHNDPVKVDLDGSVTSWGVKAPGQNRTVKEQFDSAANFTINGSNTKATSTASIAGNAGSVQVNKIDTSTTSLSITRSGLALDFSNGGDIGVWLNIPSGAIAKLDSIAVGVTLGEVGLANASSWVFTSGELRDGWNLLILDSSTPDANTGSGWTQTDVNEILFNIAFSSVGQTQSGFLWDSLFLEDRDTCTAALGSSGNVDAGTHSYKITYVSRYGKESNGSDESNTITSVGSQVSLTNVPVSPDSQVVARRVYRDNGGDALWRLVSEIGNNTETTFTDNVANASLSSLTAPEAGGEIDNSHPDRMAFCALWNGYVFGTLSASRHTLIFSLPEEPEYFPTTNQRVFEAEITAMVPLLDRLLLFSSDKIFAVTGGEDGPRSLQFTQVNSEHGCVGPRAAVKVKGVVFFWSDDGPYLTDNGVSVWYLGSSIRDTIDALDHTTFEDLFLVHDRTRFKVLSFVDGDVLTYSYGQSSVGKVSPEGVGVDPLDLRVGAWSTIVFPSSYNVKSAEVVEVSADVPEVWIGTEGGIVYRINDTSRSNWADGSQNAAISSVIETVYEQMFTEHEKRGAARYLIVKGNGTAASTWTATITTAEDAGSTTTSTVSFPVVVGPSRTSKKLAIPRNTEGVYAKVKLENATLGETAVIESLRLEMIPRPGRGVR